MLQPSFRFVYQGKTFLGTGSLELGNGVRVTLETEEFPAYRGVRWVCYFENTGKENSGIFENIEDCFVSLPFPAPVAKPIYYNSAPEDARVTSYGGMVDFQDYMHEDQLSATEYQPHDRYIREGESQAYANIGARSSNGTLPFFKLESMQEGYIVAVGWTGDWRFSVKRENNCFCVSSGLKHTHFYLKPGEKIRTGSTLVMAFSGDPVNPFRALIRDHFSPKKIDGICAFELWGGLPSEQMIKRIRQMRSLGLHYDQCWIDAGWYGQCLNCDDSYAGDWSQHTGEWEINRRIHPQLLEDVRDELKKDGTKLMLWIEPERAILGTPVTVEHPDWLLTKMTDGKKDDNTIINYGDPEAWQYTFDMISGYVEKLELGCYRQDFNVELDEYFAQNDEKDRRGITEIYHILGMYRLWDELLKKYPQLIIDNCSSGGRRFDIETISRAQAFFRSDYQCAMNANPEVIQLMNTNFSRFLPYQGCTTKVKGDLYNSRSCYAHAHGMSAYQAVFQEMSDEDILWEKKYLEEYRSVQPFFSKDYYDHGSHVYDLTSWSVWQYHDPVADEGILMAFRRSESPFEAFPVFLKGLSKGEYEFVDADTGKVTVTDNGQYTVTLKERYQSALIRYRIKK